MTRPYDIPETSLAALTDAEVTQDDPIGDPKLTCTRCGSELCSVEVGDNMRVLAAVVCEHTCPPPSPFTLAAVIYMDREV